MDDERDRVEPGLQQELGAKIRGDEMKRKERDMQTCMGDRTRIKLYDFPANTRWCCPASSEIFKLEKFLRDRFWTEKSSFEPLDLNRNSVNED